MKVQHLSGKTGSLAEKLAKPLKLHIELEEELALPLLGLLPDIAKGKLGSGVARKASSLGMRFEKEYSGMLEGHKVLRRYLENLKTIGSEEGHLTAVRFAEALEKHSREEEEVLYPAAILAGRTASTEAKTKR